MSYVFYRLSETCLIPPSFLKLSPTYMFSAYIIPLTRSSLLVCLHQRYRHATLAGAGAAAASASVFQANVQFVVEGFITGVLTLMCGMSGILLVQVSSNRCFPSHAARVACVLGCVRFRNRPQPFLQNPQRLFVCRCRCFRVAGLGLELMVVYTSLPLPDADTAVVDVVRGGEIRLLRSGARMLTSRLKTLCRHSRDRPVCGPGQNECGADVLDACAVSPHLRGPVTNELNE